MPRRRLAEEGWVPTLGNPLLSVVRKVETGWRCIYREYSSETLLGKLERSARAAGKGLWADSTPVPPWEWRKKGGS